MRAKEDFKPFQKLYQMKTFDLIKSIALMGIFALCFNFSTSAQSNKLPTSGDAGIGDTTPDGRFEIVADPYEKKPQLLLSQKGTRNNSIYFQNTSDYKRFWGMKANPGNSKTRFNFFYEPNDSTTFNILSMTGDKKVGINTTNPEQALQVDGGVLVHSGKGNLNIGYPGSHQWKFSTIGGGQNLQLWTNPATGSDELVAYFKQNGNVGIGTSNPTQKLEVAGKRLRLSTPSNPGRNIEMRTDGAHMDINANGGNLYLHSNSGNTILQRFSGKVILGASSSGYSSKLHVAGGASFSDWVRINGNTDGTAWKLGVNGPMIQRNGNVRLAQGSGNVAIGGTYASGYKLSVDGKVMCEELKVQLSGSWPDYVFEENYELTPLDELEAEIEAKGHLPGIPSAQEVESEGISVGEMQKKMMEKIEELTLYVIDLKKENNELRALINQK